MRIIYKNTDDSVVFLAPAPNWECSSGKMIKDLTGDELLVALEELAQKDVPTGLKYKIIADSDQPSDRTFRKAWTVDDKELTDGVGS